MTISRPFLTGGKTEINALFKKLEVFTPDIQAHTPFNSHRE